MPLKLFIRLFPEYPIPRYIDIDDEEYIVRYDESTKPFNVEIGYKDDDWVLTLE